MGERLASSILFTIVFQLCMRMPSTCARWSGPGGSTTMKNVHFCNPNSIDVCIILFFFCMLGCFKCQRPDLALPSCPTTFIIFQKLLLASLSRSHRCPVAVGAAFTCRGIRVSTSFLLSSDARESTHCSATTCPSRIEDEASKLSPNPRFLAFFCSFLAGIGKSDAGSMPIMLRSEKEPVPREVLKTGR